MLEAKELAKPKELAKAKDKSVQVSLTKFRGRTMQYILRHSVQLKFLVFYIFRQIVRNKRQKITKILCEEKAKCA